MGVQKCTGHAYARLRIQNGVLAWPEGASGTPESMRWRVTRGGSHAGQRKSTGMDALNNNTMHKVLEDVERGFNLVVLYGQDWPSICRAAESGAQVFAELGAWVSLRKKTGTQSCIYSVIQLPRLSRSGIRTFALHVPFLSTSVTDDRRGRRPHTPAIAAKARNASDLVQVHFFLPTAFC